MEEIRIATRSVLDQTSRSRTFHYALVVEQVESGRFTCEDYGVKITEEGGESATVPGITTSAVRIDELLELLIRNRVGPASLHDVIADWL